MVNYFWFVIRTLQWIINDEIKERLIYYSLRENITYNREIFVDFFFKYSQNFHIIFFNQEDIIFF